jgi:hypothetical protein
MKDTITVNVYNTTFESKDFICSFQMKKYKNIKTIKKKLIDFIRLQEDEKNQKFRFYCFDLYHYNMKIKESDLNNINY